MNGRHRTSGFLLVFITLHLAACGDDGTADGGDGGADAGLIEIVDVAGCNPLVPAACPYPFPNMMLVDDDAASATGFRVNLHAGNMGFVQAAPFNVGALGAYMSRADGFSLGTPILTHLGTGDVDRATLPSFEDLGASVMASSTVQLIHRGSGERVPVWAETDLRALSDDERTVMIRPQGGLDPAARYVVVITTGVKATSGADLEASDAYRALRDGVPTTSAIVEGMRAEYEELFTFLEAQGVARADTLLAWEWVTHSDDFAMGLVRPHVELAREAATDPSMIPCDGCAAPLSYEITECLSSTMADATATGCTYDDTLHATELRRITGTFVVPSFLDPVTGVIELDAAGAPLLKETLEAELIVHVPASLAAAAPGTAPVLVFGHGLLAEATDYLHHDLDAGGVQALANRLNAVVVATRWVGLSKGDEPAIVDMLGNGEMFQPLVEGLVQSMVATTLLPPLARSDFKDDAVLGAAGGAGSLLDTSRVYYYGISLGGIFGTVFAALSSDVKTAVLHVPTGAFSNVLQHSYLFGDFQNILTFLHQSRIEQQLYLAYTQRLFDPADPINWVRHLGSEGAVTPLGAKNCLFQVAWGDAAAPDFNAYTFARQGGIPLVDASPHHPYGLEALATPSGPGATAMTIFDPGLGRRALRNDDGETPPYAHGSIRRNPEVQDQIVAYFTEGTEGTVTANCGGPCNVTPVPVEGEATYP